MRLTQEHARFWAWQKVPACLRFGKAPDVNYAVNAHSITSKRLTSEPGNTLVLLRYARKRQEPLQETLLRLGKGYADEPRSLAGERKVWVRRWQRRLASRTKKQQAETRKLEATLCALVYILEH